MAADEQQLRQASSNGSLDEVKSLIEKGVKQTPNEEGEAPLHLATSCYVTDPEYVEIVRALLDADGDQNVPSKDGNLPIHNSSGNGNLEIAELLLDYGAPLDVAGEDGHLPLELAATKKHHAVVNLVVKRLVDKNTFTANQIKWMSIAKDETAQLGVYRALASICQIKEAMPHLIKLNVIDAILCGLSRFQKKSVQSHGLKLLQTIMKHADGPTALKSNKDLKKRLETIIESNQNDAVILHLSNSILKEI